MEWSELKSAVENASSADHKLNEALFAQAYGWSYPLFGAARQQFDRETRENGLTNYTGSTDSAIVFTSLVFPKSSFIMQLDDNGVSGVSMTAVLDEWEAEATGQTSVVGAAKASSLPLAIVLATLNARLSILPVRTAED
jgi:hypothetical protein